jgi:hypothetical protein
LRGEIRRAGSKPVTETAQRARQPAVSNAVTGATPLRPAVNASRNPSSDVPKGDTTPMPDTTIPVDKAGVRYHYGR